MRLSTLSGVVISTGIFVVDCAATRPGKATRKEDINSIDRLGHLFIVALLKIDGGFLLH